MKRLYFLLIFPLALFSQNGFYTSQHTVNSAIFALINTVINKKGEFWTGLNYINSTWPTQGTGNFSRTLAVHYYEYAYYCSL